MLTEMCPFFGVHAHVRHGSHTSAAAVRCVCKSEQGATPRSDALRGVLSFSELPRAVRRP